MTKDTASSARRALRVLKALKGHTLTGLANKEIAETLRESPVNVSRSLEVLMDEGLVARLENGRYAHSVGMLQIAQAHVRHSDAIQNRLTEINCRIAAGASS